MANIVTDYGAIADGQWSKQAFTITSGTKDLFSTSAIWSAGDAGKAISVAFDQFSLPHLTTIASFVSSTHVVLTDNMPVTMSSSTHYVCWGTDNKLAFRNFREANVGGTVVLTMPAGSYYVSIGYGDGSSGYWPMFSGISNLTVNATGASLLGGVLQLGGLGQVQISGNLHCARTVTVSVGSSFVTLVTPSQVSRFAVGQWCLMTGIDLQGLWQGGGYGYPTNAHFFEFLQITSIDANSGSPTYGKISFSTPLSNAYKSTWPLWDDGTPGGINEGGPAILYALDPWWNCSYTFNDLTLVHELPSGQIGRSITFNNCTIHGGVGNNNGIFPSVCKDWTLNSCVLSDCTIEVDKSVGTITLDSTSVNVLEVQSSSVNQMNINNCPIDLVFGTPKATTISNSTIGHLIPGPHTYGRGDSLTCNNCVIPIFGGTDHSAGYSVGDIRPYMTMSNGTITVPNTRNAQAWCVPGTICFFGETNHLAVFGFTILDVTQDATNIYVATNWLGSFPPNLSGGDGTLYIYPHPCPSFTMTGCTGNDYVVALSRSPAGLPLYSHLKRTYNNAQSANAQVDEEYFPILGRVVELKITVDTAYTGSLGATILPKTRFATLLAADYSLVTTKNPTINLKVAGTRTLNTSGGYPAVWSGAQSGDSLSNYTEALWVDGYWQNVMSDLSGDPSHPVSVTVEITTDQGVTNALPAVVPLRFRLRR